MRRAISLSASSIFVSAALLAAFTHTASAETANAAPDAPAKAGAAAEASKKPLHTVPEDGMVTPNPMAATTKAVRDMLMARSKEDLVICIAGCNPWFEHVVYAQPSELPPPPPAPAAKPMAETGAPAAEQKDQAGEQSKPQADAAPADAPLPQLVPSMAVPNASDGAPAGTPPDAAPAADEAPAADAAPAPEANPEENPEENPDKAQ